MIPLTPIRSALLLFSAVLTCAAQDKPFALQVLETEFRNDLASRLKLLDDKYRAALDQLQKSYAAEGNLEGVLAVRSELARLDKAVPAPAPAPGGVPGSPALAPDRAPADRRTLAAATARLAGNIQHDAEHGVLGNWKDSGAAEWSLAGIPPGRYRIVMHYFSGPFAGGRIKLEAGSTSAELEISGAGKWEDPKQLELGQLTIRSNAERLRLSILSARVQGVMELRSIELIPIRRR